MAISSQLGSTELTAEWQDPLGNTLGSLDLVNDVIQLNYTLVENGIHILEFEMCYCSDAQRIKCWDRIVIRYRDCDSGTTVIEGDTCWFIMKVHKPDESNTDKVYHFYAQSVDNQLARRVIPYYGNSPLTDKTGSAGDIMVQIVYENLLGGSVSQANGTPDPFRDLSNWVSSDMPIGLGALTDNTHAWDQSILTILQELAQDSNEQGVPLFFNMLCVQSGLRFKVFEGVRGVDRTIGSGAVTLSVDNGGLTRAVLIEDCTHEVNVAYAAGRGRNAGRQYGYYNENGRSQLNPFARSEVIIDGRQVDSGNVPAVLDEMARTRVNEGKPLRYVEAQFNNGIGSPFRYNRDWRWGDIVTISHGTGFDQVTFPARVSRVRVTVKDAVVSIGETFQEGTGVLFREATAGV